MTYCNAGEKPKVTYQFNGSQTVEYLSPTAPIDITTGLAPSSINTPNYNANGYQISFSSPQVASGTFIGIVTDYSVRTGSDGNILDPHTVNFVKFIQCGESTYHPEVVATSDVVVNYNIHCPATANSAVGQCQIVVSHDGVQIFKATGNCPISFVIACDGRCPEGTCECKTANYPGYCCNDCGATAVSIQSIKNKLQNK